MRVAWTTRRSSGERLVRAAPTSLCSTPSSTWSSALSTGVRTASRASAVAGDGASRPRSRQTSRRIAIPQIHAATSPSPRHLPADLQTATNVS